MAEEKLLNESAGNSYATTFNYLLAQCVIPQLMFSDLDGFYEKALAGPDSFQAFLQKAVAHAAAVALGKPEIEQAYPIEEFKTEVYGNGKNPDNNVVMVQFPKINKTADCTAAAIPVFRKNAGYYTCELAISPAGDDCALVLGEWVKSGDTFKHNNHGEIIPDTMGRFIEMVIEKAYGSNIGGINAGDIKTNLIEEDAPVVKSNNQEAQMYYNKGTQYMIDNQLDKAQYCLMKALELDSAFINAIDHLAIVYRRQGNLQEAEKLYLQSASLNEKSTVPYANLALIYRQTDRLGDAAKMYQKIQQMDPENPESYYGMGALYQSIGEYAKSKEFFDEAVVIYLRTKSNMLYDALYNQGTNFYHLKDYPKALECFVEAQKAHPDDEYLKKMIAQIKGLGTGD